MPSRLAIVASHVIQYQDPLFRLIAREPDIELEVLYCSRHGLDAFHDTDMATTLRWDIETLGYPHRFLWNASRDLNRGVWRLVNPGIVPLLARGHYDAVIFMTGWGSFTAILGMATCRLLRIPFFLYGDSSFPPPEIDARSRIRAGLMRALFAVTSGFMVSGVLNAAYYQHYGADPKHFFLLPWAVDNERFAAASKLTAEERGSTRERLGIARDQIVIVYSAKLVPRKDPMTLLRAFAQMTRRSNAALLFLGDGELRPALEEYVRENSIPSVHFPGFINQTELPKYYAIGDIFVLPSLYEPRGAVINEAMVCGLPLIVTDRCGSIGDIVLENQNAFIYPAGGTEVLTSYLDLLAGDDALRKRMGRRSLEIISKWNFASGVEGVRRMLAWVR